MPCVDLHVHSTASDGMYSPSRVVEMAREAGLSAIVLSDHDSMGGLDEAVARGREVGVEVVPGVELTSYWARAEIHVLGMFVDASRALPVSRVLELKAARRERMLAMVAKLRDLGVEVALDEVLTECPDGAVGRPHLAAVIARKGYAADENDAFVRYLRHDGPAYVRKKELSPEEAIALVLELGGLPVLAHPGTCRVDERFADFVSAGLAGIEVRHPKHGEADVAHYARLAERRGLLPSGGSDFHGPGRSDTPMGVPEVDSSWLEALRERHAALMGA